MTFPTSLAMLPPQYSAFPGVNGKLKISTPAVPLVQVGYTQAINYNWWLYDQETTPELVWPQSVAVYDQMRRQDSQIKSVLNAVMWPILRTNWRVDPNGASAMVTQFVADDLGLPIVGRPDYYPTRRRKQTGSYFDFKEHLRQALQHLVFGHYYFEQTYRIDDDGKTAHLENLWPRPPKTIERLEVAQDGSLLWIQQLWVSKGQRPMPIPADRLVVYVNEMEGGNWLGISILRPAYKNWLLKDRLLRVQAQTIERNGMGIPLYTGAEGEESLDQGLKMAKAWKSGEAAGSAVPFGSSLSLVGVSGTLPDAEPAIRYHDEQIGKAVLAHFLNLGNTRGTGSWALGSTFADFFTLALQTVAQEFANTFTCHVIEDLVDVNFGPDEPAPVLTFDEIGQRADAQGIAVLLQSGALQPDDTLEAFTRNALGLPPKDQASAAIRQDQANGGGQPGPGQPVPQEPDQFDQSVAASAPDDDDPDDDDLDGGPDDDPDGPDDDDPSDGEERELSDVERSEVDALVDALDAVDALGDQAERVLAGYNPNELRQLKGHVGGGQFASTLNGKLIDALKQWLDGKNDRPLDGFSATQLRKAIKDRGLPAPAPKTKASAMRRLILDDVKAKHGVTGEVHPTAEAVATKAKLEKAGKAAADKAELAKTTDVLSEVHQLIHDGASDKAIEARLEARRKLGAPNAEIESLLEAIDPVKYEAGKKGAYVPPHVKDIKTRMMGLEGTNGLPDTLLYSGANKATYRKYFDDNERAVILDKLKKLLPKTSAEGKHPQEHEAVKRAISDLESIGNRDQRLKTALGELEQKHGLTRIGEAGAGAKFTPSQHESIAGHLGTGKAVTVVAPGYKKGNAVHSKAKVHEGAPSVKEPAPAKKATPKTPTAQQLEDAVFSTGGAKAHADTAAVEAEVRKAYDAAAGKPGAWVSLALVRKHLDDAGVSREQADEALKSLAVTPGVHVIPWDNYKALTPADHEAALKFGGQANHAIRFEPSVPAPAKVPSVTTSPGKPIPGEYMYPSMKHWDVKINGEKVGSVHGVGGIWEAYRLDGKPVQGIGGSKSFGTKADAMDALTSPHMPPGGAQKMGGLTFTPVGGKGAPEGHFHVHNAQGEHLGDVRKEKGLVATSYAAHTPEGDKISYGNVTKLQAANVLKKHAADKKKASIEAEGKHVKVSKAVAGVDGVTYQSLTPKVDYNSPNKVSQRVFHNGVEIGSIHQKSYGWTAETPGGGHVGNLGYKATKGDAIKGLLAKKAEIEAKRGPTFPAAKPVAPGQKAPSVMGEAKGKLGLAANPGEPSAAEGAAGVLVRSTGGGEPKYLLTRNAAGKWTLPGGARGSNEDAYQRASRGIVESGGKATDLKGIKPVGEHVNAPNASGGKFTTITAETAKEFAPSDGSQWFTHAEIRQLDEHGHLATALGKTHERIIGSYPAPGPGKMSAHEAKIRTGDFSDLTKVSGPQGFNEGGIYQTPDGQQWYVKRQLSKANSDNEAGAAAFYRAAGISSPEIIQGGKTPGLAGEHHTATKFIPGAKVDLRERIKGAAKGNAADKAYMREVHKGFATDAWLANWDVAGANPEPGKGYDNTVNVNGDPVRIDTGGALQFKGTGGSKGNGFGPKVTEWDVFTNPNSTEASAAMFDGITPAEMVASAERVKAITPAKIRAIAKQNGLPDSVAETLILRRQDIMSRAKEAAKAAKAKPFAHDAKVGNEALGSVHISGISGTAAQQLMSEGVAHDQAVQTGESLSHYKGSGSIPINDFLLDNKAAKNMSESEREKNAEHVRNIDVAFSKAALPNDIVVYRGDPGPASQFPAGEWSKTGGMEGKEWIFPAYASSSTAHSTASYFAHNHNHVAGGQPTIMRIVVPKGTAVVSLDKLDKYGNGEAEVLLNRHLKYRVVKDHGVTNGIRNLDVEVVH